MAIGWLPMPPVPRSHSALRRPCTLPPRAATKPLVYVAIRLSMCAWRWQRSEERCIRFQSEQNPAGGRHHARLDGDVLGERVHVAKRAFQRTARVKRARACRDVEDVDCLDSARYGVRGGQPD